MEGVLAHIHKIPIRIDLSWREEAHNDRVQIGDEEQLHVGFLKHYRLIRNKGMEGMGSITSWMRSQFWMKPR